MKVFDRINRDSGVGRIAVFQRISRAYFCLSWRAIWSGGNPLLRSLHTIIRSFYSTDSLVSYLGDEGNVSMVDIIRLLGDQDGVFPN